jgi:hypothetical protein
MAGFRRYGNGQLSVADFDFFVGSWNSVQRKLKKPLADCDEWEESSATTLSWQVFGGAANLDEVHFPDWSFSGLSVRLLNPATGSGLSTG